MTDQNPNFFNEETYRKESNQTRQDFWKHEAAREQIISEEHLRLAAEAQERRVTALINAGYNIRRIGRAGLMPDETREG